MNKKIRFFSAFMSIMFVIAMMPVQSVLGLEEVSTKKMVALGDSIAYGMSAEPGAGYVDLLFKELNSKAEYKGLELVNKSNPGDNSSDLLNKLKNDNNIRNEVSKAKIIALSIGGNDILGPIVKYIAAMYELSTEDPNFQAKLSKKITEDPQLLLKLAVDEKIPAMLKNGIITFGANWGKIITEIKKLSPKADVYALALYNPCKSDSKVFGIVDTFTKSINNIISMPNKGYKIANVYQPFITRQNEQLVDFDLFAGKLDFHPTTKGHKVIFEEHLKATEIKECAFSDIKGNWAENHIKMLFTKGIISGYNNKDFKPKNSMTRAEAVAVIVKALGYEPLDGNLNFSDASKIPGWGSGYIKVAIEKGIITGYPDNTFKPSETVTRAELTVMIMKGLGNKNLISSKTTFADDQSIPEWTKGYIAKANELGIVSGYPNKTFKAKATVLRGEVCAMLVNLLNKKSSK